jgi:hypothetical protein
MENKEFKGIIAALEKIAGEQKRVTGALLEKLEISTDGLIGIIQEHNLDDNLKRFDFKNFGFREIGSQHGSSIYFCFIDEYGYNTVLPTNTSNIASSTYLHGDFNAKIHFMNRTNILNACEVLTEFIQNMVSKIQSLTDKEQKFINQFLSVE